MSYLKRCNEPRGFTRMGGRMLSLLLVLLMVVTPLPRTALAGGVSGNLVTNGDFESGNTSFTTGYTEYTEAFDQHNAMDAGFYKILRNAKTEAHGGFSDAHDHTKQDGTGYYFAANGSASNADVVWRSGSTISVTAGVVYRFEAYLMTQNSNAGNDNMYPELRFDIGSGENIDAGNWVTLGNAQVDQDVWINGTVGEWHLVYADVKFSSTGVYNIRLMNNQTAGYNDFGVDDIYFGLRSEAPSVGTNPGVDASQLGETDPPAPTSGGDTAPTFTHASISLGSIDEDSTPEEGTTVAALLLAAGASGESGRELGIALTNVDTANGQWLYQNDNATWWAIPASISDSSAFLMNADGKIKFYPSRDFNGTASVSFRVWDHTSGTVGDRVDVSSGNSGETTAFSNNAVTATITVNPVNDAPLIIRSGNGNLQLEFDGANDYLSIADDLHLDNSFTVEGWVRVDDYVNHPWSRFFDFAGYDADADRMLYYQLLLFTNEGALKFEVYGNDVFTSEATVSNDKLTINQWNYITAVYDETDIENKKQRLYLNGTLIAEEGVYFNKGDQSRGHNYFGKSNVEVDAYFKGAMKNISVWKDVRTAEEIVNDMTTPPAASADNLVLYYPLNEGAGADTVQNIAGSSYSGTLENGLKLGPSELFSYAIAGYLGQNIAVNEIELKDVDIADNDMTLTLSALHGTLTFGSIPPGVAATGNGTASVSLVGSISDLNAALESLIYQSASGYTGFTDEISVEVEDEANATDSEKVYVTLTAPNEAVAPTISSQPVDQTAALGTGATFSVTVSAPVSGNTYQWQKLVGSTWTGIENATSPSLTVSPVASADNGARYQCVVTNTVGSDTKSTTSSAATLTVTYPVTVSTRTDGAAAPAPGTVTLRQDGAVKATATDSETTGTYTANVPNGTYSVYIDGVDTGKTVTVSNAAAAADPVDYYTVSFSAADSGLASGSTVSAQIGATLFSSGATVLAGRSAALTATGAGALSYSYLWSGTGTSGQTTNTITLTVNAPINATCTVTGSASYSVTLNANGGTINSGNVTSHPHGAAVTLPTDVTRVNATFAGWYASSDFSGEPVTQISAEETGTKTYHAKWINSITYSLNYSGAGSYLSATALHDGTMTAPQTAPTRNGYIFTGWYKDALCLDPWSFTDDTVTKNLTLYAGWAATVHAVTGTVVDETPAPVSGASVILMKGNTQFKSAVTNGTGQFTLTDVPDGSYNLVVSEGEKIVTTYVTVKNGILSPNHITMPGKKFSQLTVKGNDTPSVVADGLNNQFTAADQDAIDLGGTVRITLEVEKVTPSGTTASAIQIAAAGKTIDFYLDMTVYHQLNSDPAIPLPTVQNLLKIMVPYDLTGKSNVTVYRYHSSQAAALTRITNESNAADGTYLLDTANHQIIIWAQNFSTYAVAYTTGGDQGHSDQDSGGSNGNNSGTSPSRTISVTETSSSLFKGSTAPVKAEANMNNAFTNSVEVKVTDTAESADSFGLGSGVKVYPFDISFYIKGTNTKTQPAKGYAVTISLPVPASLMDKREKLSVVHKGENGLVATLNSRLTQMDGVWYLTFEAAGSPYALVVTGDQGGKTPSSSAVPERIFGQNAYDTAVEIARAYFPKGADTVILARGDISADALPTVPLAKLYNAPLLLTEPNRLPDHVLKAIQELGTQKVIIIGGPGAIKESVENTLKQNGLTVERVYGETRYDTAYEIAKRLGTTSGQAVIVNGNLHEKTYADALSISPWAGSKGVPILYGDSSKTVLPESTAKAIWELGITRTILIGGTAVLPAGLEKNLPQTVRYGGENLYDTNLLVLKGLQADGEEMYVVTGKGFADALAGAVVAAQREGLLILTGTGLTHEQEEYLKEVKDRIKDFHVFGGGAAVPESTVENIKSLLGR